ncbi:MAG: transposase [Deinococcales bacterium]
MESPPPPRARASYAENADVLTSFLRSLLDRGLNISQGILVVIDGSKGLRAAVRRAFKDRALVQRCVWHYAERRIMWIVGKNAQWEADFGRQRVA